MNRRYVLAPEAALDLVQLWRYIEQNAGLEMADRVESAVLAKIVFLASRSGAGHWRKDLTARGGEILPDLLLLDRLPP